MLQPGSGVDAVDRAQLARVSEAVGKRALRDYAALYCELLGDRIDRVVHGEIAEGLRAAQDLQTGSDMFGAKRLATLAAEAAVLLRGGVPISAWRIEALYTEAEAVIAALHQALDGSSPLLPGRLARPSITKAACRRPEKRRPDVWTP